MGFGVEASSVLPFAIDPLLYIVGALLYYARQAGRDVAQIRNRIRYDAGRVCVRSPHWLQSYSSCCEHAFPVVQAIVAGPAGDVALGVWCVVIFIWLLVW